MASVDNELEHLRRRAYGPQADIHLDSRALERLRELEGAQNAARVAEAGETFESKDTVETVSPAAAHTVDNSDPVDEAPESVDDAPPARSARDILGGWIRRISKLRRSTVVIGLAAVACVVAVVVTLTLVQRVQTDPLQTGATQIARLQPDSGYRIPDIFGGPGGGNGNAQAFEKFHGLRVVVTAIRQTEASRVTGDCLSIYLEADVTDPSSNSFTGPFFNGCGAGRFPPIEQFDLRSQQELPVGLRDALAPWVALQFVFDKRDDEVVVFASK
jgi:hypothetical protein